jgi:beta-phosphoglucomutase-like phosphatase (HAD superfamily)
MTKIKYILFDMDGVLIDAKEWHYEALNEALNIFGKQISRYDHLTVFDGKPTKDKLSMLSKVGEIPVELHQIINQMKQKYTMRKIFNLCKSNFTHQRTLSKLKSQGIKMAVCSNSIRNSVEFMLKNAGIIEYFEFFISNEDVNKGKPDPEMYLNAMTKFNAKPDECLILEDNENGIKAAIASGAHLLQIFEVTDVNYENIINKINNLEK